MSPDGKVKVVVRSRRVPVRTVDVRVPVFSTSGVFMGTRSNRLVLYGSALDDNHKRAIEEGQKLSCSLGLDLEVVDASKSGLFRRMLSLLGLGGSELPALTVAPLSSEGEECVPQALGPTR